MEGKPSSPDVRSTMFDKKEKKKKKKKKRRQLDSLGRESPEPAAPEGLGDPGLAEEVSEQPWDAKRKRSRREALPLAPPLPEADRSPRGAGLTSVVPHKKKRRSSLRVDTETGVVYVLVDSENSENVPKNFGRDVDVVFVDVSKPQRAAPDPGTCNPPAAVSSPQKEPAELRPHAKKKKKKRPQGLVPDSARHAPWESDGGQGSPRTWGEVPKSPHAARDSDGAQDSPQGTPRHTSWGEVWVSPRTPSPLRLRESCVPETPPAPQPGHGNRGKTEKQKRALSGFRDSEAPVAVRPEPMGSRSQDEPTGVEAAAGGRKKKTKKRKLRAPGGGLVGAAPLGGPRPGQPLTEPEDGHSTAGVEESPRPGPRAESPEMMEEPPRSPLPDDGGSSQEPAREAGSRRLSEDPQDSGDSDVDLGTAVRQLQEFIPDIRDRAATTIKRMYRDDLGRFKEFKAQGVTIKFGKFSEKENKQLEQNVQDFLALTGIESADKLLYTDRYPEEKSAITDLKRKYSFRVHIGKGIARPWKLVYYRAKKMFDVNNYKGRYSPGEEEKLKAYHALHGNDWKKIGALVARSSLSVALKYSQISSARNRGTWSKTETQKLTKAVEEVILKKMSPQELSEVDSRLQESPERCLTVVREKLYKGISWVEVEARVETRNWMQCKSKWMEILTRRMTNGQRVYRGLSALQAKVNLIERLYEINVEDANEIDWEDLAGIIGDVPPSYVQTKFYKLKATCVPCWQKKTFPEIIDYLYEVTLPLLKEKLEKLMEKRGSEVQTPAVPRQAFLLRDIFCTEDSEGEGGSEHS